VKISIIIPTYNEAENIAALVTYLKTLNGSEQAEIIVSDGGSTDNTLELAKEAGAKAFFSPTKGRAAQMNYGVSKASGYIYYFVHADTKPCSSSLEDIQQAIFETFDCGSFRTQFDSKSFMLKINAWCTRFNYLFFRGGDQSIFITKELFEKVNGFDEQFYIMEDYNFLEKIWKAGKFKLIPKSTLVSARKYDNNTWLSVQLANLKVVKMFKKGASQEDMLQTYKSMLKYRKNAF
jgi:rSAM/selenodomain-associated transferase 2